MHYTEMSTKINIVVQTVLDLSKICGLAYTDKMCEATTLRSLLRQKIIYVHSKYTIMNICLNQTCTCIVPFS
jgi:hypothetical protein